MLCLSLIVFLSGVTFGAAEPQTREQDARANAVRSALSPEYDSCAEAYYRNPPSTLEGLVKAALNWPELSRQIQLREEAPGNKGFDTSKRIKDGWQMNVQIEKVKYSPAKVVLTVSKRMTGFFRQGNSSRTGKVESYTLWRHAWINTGSGWKVLTMALDEGWIRMNGKAFTSLPRGFDPNKSFKMGDIVEKLERQPN